jgi:hypothetical protein
MLNKKKLVEELDKLSLNFSVDVRKGYTSYIYETLNQYGFTDDDLKETIKTIAENETSLYAKMPNIAMFLKYKPKRESIDFVKRIPKPKMSKEDKLHISNSLNELIKKLKKRGAE